MHGKVQNGGQNRIGVDLLGDAVRSDLALRLGAFDMGAWRGALGLSRVRAAEALGVGRNQYGRYERDGTTPLTVRLAASALLAGLPPVRAK